MDEPTVTQRIGRVRVEIRRYLCKESSSEALNAFLRGLGLEITLRPEGAYEFRIPLPAGALTPLQEQTLVEMPKLHAVDPPRRTPEALLIQGYDVECLPALLTELTQARLLALADFP